MAAPTVLSKGYVDSNGDITLAHEATSQAVVCGLSNNSWWARAEQAAYEGEPVTPWLTGDFSTGATSPIDADAGMAVRTVLTGTGTTDTLACRLGQAEPKYKGFMLGHADSLALRDSGETGWVTSDSALTVSVDPGGQDCIAVVQLVTGPGGDPTGWTATPAGGTDEYDHDYSRHKVRYYTVPVLASDGVTEVGFTPPSSTGGYVSVLLIGPDTSSHDAPTVLSHGQGSSISLPREATSQAVVCPSTNNGWWGSLAQTYEGVAVPDIISNWSSGTPDSDSFMKVLLDLSGGTTPADTLVGSGSGEPWYNGLMLGHADPLLLKDYGSVAWASQSAPCTVTLDPDGADCLAIVLLLTGTATANDPSRWLHVPAEGSVSRFDDDYSRHSMAVFTVPVLASDGPTAVGFNPTKTMTGYVAAVLIGAEFTASGGGRRRRPTVFMPIIRR